MCPLINFKDLSQLMQKTVCLYSKWIGRPFWAQIWGIATAMFNVWKERNIGMCSGLWLGFLGEISDATKVLVSGKWANSNTHGFFFIDKSLLTISLTHCKWKFWLINYKSDSICYISKSYLSGNMFCIRSACPFIFSVANQGPFIFRIQKDAELLYLSRLFFQ